MLTVRLPLSVRKSVENACRRAGIRETGGMLFGEHLGGEEFRIVEATFAGTGSLASFVRGIVGALPRLEHFFRRTKHEYRRFNYLGEWHSHPSFALYPSTTDEETMFSIVNDPETGARFAVSLIVKIEDDGLAAAAFAYYRDGEREKALVALEVNG